MTANHQTVVLRRGRHAGPDHGACVMELASMLAGESFTDHPRSACPVLGALLRRINDRLDDTMRQQLYGCAAAVVGTGGDTRASEARAARCAELLNARRRTGLGRWLRRDLVPPRDPLGPQLESLAAAAVRSFPKTPEGDAALLALVDELLAVSTADGGADATPEPALVH